MIELNVKLFNEKTTGVKNSYAMQCLNNNGSRGVDQNRRVVGTVLAVV